MACAHDAPQVPLDQSHPSAFHRNVGPGSHRDTNLRLGERGRVVDSVARHRHEAALALQPLHDVHLLVGKNLGNDVVDLELPGHRLGRGPAITRQHNDADALKMERADRLGGAVLDRVGHADQAGRLAIDRDEHDRLSFGAQAFRLLGQLAKFDTELGHQRGIAEGHGTAVHAAAHALAGDALEGRDISQLHATVLAALDDGRSERMLAAPLEGRGEAKQGLFFEARGG